MLDYVQKIVLRYMYILIMYNKIDHLGIAQFLFVKFLLDHHQHECHLIVYLLQNTTIVPKNAVLAISLH